jgi:hypothetical protein
MHGCRWIIGDGSKIKVMNDPWLRSIEGGWVKAPQNQGVYNLNVQNLMLPGIKRWDHAKINLLFSEPEANNILAVPLLDMIQEDRLIWNEERDGVYSIRSEYRKLMKDKKNVDWSRVKEPCSS